MRTIKTLLIIIHTNTNDVKTMVTKYYNNDGNGFNIHDIKKPCTDEKNKKIILMTTITVLLMIMRITVIIIQRRRRERVRNERG